MSEMNKLCKGCLVAIMCDNIYEAICEICPLAHSGNEKECPCVNCLVKSMCQRSCSEFHYIDDEINRY